MTPEQYVEVAGCRVFPTENGSEVVFDLRVPRGGSWLSVGHPFPTMTAARLEAERLESEGRAVIVPKLESQPPPPADVRPDNRVLPRPHRYEAQRFPSGRMNGRQLAARIRAAQARANAERFLTRI